MFPCDAVLREGSTATYCCVPPAGGNITNISIDATKYSLLSIGARAKAITVENLQIPKRGMHTLTCTDSTGHQKRVWNYVGCEYELLFMFTFLHVYMHEVYCGLCSSSTEAQEPQLFHDWPVNCHLHLGSRQSSKQAQQINTHPPQGVSNAHNNNIQPVFMSMYYNITITCCFAT